MNLFGEDIENDDGAEDEVSSSTPPPAALLPPRENPICLGHEEVERQLLPLQHENRMPHAVIFSGPEGIGKATFAFRLARFMLSQPVEDPNQSALFGPPEPPPPAETLALDPGHPVFRRVASGGHPDLLVAERKTDEAKGRKAGSLEVAEIRKIAPFLRLSASEGGWRVVIVDDADTMTRSSQNALLKILEEPPPHTLIILIAHRAGGLIPTIRSRSRVFAFTPLREESLRAVLKTAGHDLAPAEFEALSVLAEGSAGKAIALLEEGGLEVMGKVLDIFRHYPGWKGSDIHRLAEDLGRAGQDQAFAGFQDVMCWIARKLATCKARGMPLPSGPLQAAGAFEALLSSMPLHRLIGIYDDLQTHFEQGNRANLERRQTVMQAFQFFAI